MNKYNEFLYDNSDDYLEDLLKDISHAKKSIDIEYYLISNDLVGKRLFLALKEAVKKNIKVRVLVDGWGAHEFLPVLIDWAHQYNINLQIHNPPIWVHEAIPSFYDLFKINQRTHRKLVIIDDKFAYTGSINLSSEHFKKYSHDKAWLDIGIKITDDRVHLIKNVFESSWEQQTQVFPYTSDIYLPDKSTSIRANQTRERRHELYNDLIERIEKAQQAITIINPYFVPTKRLKEALKKAAFKGVNIRIIVPQKSDLKLFPWFNSIGIRKLDRYGVIFYEYLPSILHSKITIIDDFYMIGSSNWNNRSFYHDRELDIEIKTEKCIEDIDKVVKNIFSKSKKISYKAIRLRFAKDYFYRPFFYVCRYWL